MGVGVRVRVTRVRPTREHILSGGQLIANHERLSRGELRGARDCLERANPRIELDAQLALHRGMHAASALEFAHRVLGALRQRGMRVSQRRVLVAQRGELRLHLLTSATWQVGSWPVGRKGRGR